jgi:hypothetical protein
MRKAAVAVVVALTAGPGLAQNGPADDRPWLPCDEALIPRVCAAAKLDESATRTDDLKEALAAALQSDNAAVRDIAFRYLRQIASPPQGFRDVPFDPRLVRDELHRYDATEWEASRRELGLEPGERGDWHRDAGQALLDSADLNHAPRIERLHVYETAIDEGWGNYGRASRISRVDAILRATDEGLSDLEPAIAAHCPELDRQEIQFLGGCDYIRQAIELRAGAETRSDADSLAAKRLAAMPASALYAKLESSQVWRRLFDETAEAVCERGSLRDCKGLEPVFRDLDTAQLGRPTLGTDAARPTPYELRDCISRARNLVSGRLQRASIEVKDHAAPPR